MNIKKNNEYLLCEQNRVYYTLIMVSGFWGAFTYLLRGMFFAMHKPEMWFFLDLL